MAQRMARFCAELSRHGVREARRRGQLELPNEARTREPFFRAGFNAVGDWR